MDRVKRIWYLSLMRAGKVQGSLRIRAVSPEPSLLAHTSSESRGTFRQKARSLAPLNGWACAVKMCHDGMLEDTKSLDGAQIIMKFKKVLLCFLVQCKECLFLIVRMVRTIGIDCDLSNCHFGQSCDGSKSTINVKLWTTFTILLNAEKCLVQVLFPTTSP